MRLHRLELTGVGPFKEPQKIDFDELSASGLFLIEGPTGSGKTTIIDAIVYAMFGVVSSGADDVTRMRIRSNFAEEGDPTGVACEFSVDGRRHRVTRVPMGARDPQEPDKPAKSKGVRQTLTEFAADGSVVRVLTARKEIDEHVEQLLGMTAEQFRQLVVLPQGQFADLLRKTPAERLASLAPLLEDDFIARVQDDLEHQGRQAQERCTAAGTRVDQAAQRLAGRLKAWLEAAPPEGDFTDATAADDARAAVVDAVLAAIDAEAEAAATARDEQERATQTLRDTAKAAADVLAILRDVTDAQQAVADARAALPDEDLDVTEKSISTRLGHLQRLEGSLEADAAWEAAAPARATEREQLTLLVEQARAAAARLQEERTALPAQRTTLQAQQAELQKRAGGLAAARAEEERLARLVQTAAELAQAQALLAQLATALEQAESDESLAQVAADAAVVAWEDLVTQQHAGTAAALASLLTAGEACPVCGSLEHPSPAGVAAGADVVTDEQVAAARERATKARESAGQAGTTTQRARTAHVEQTTTVATLAGAVGAQDAESLTALHADAVATREAAEAAADGLPEVVRALEALAEQETTLGTQVAEKETEATRLEATIAANDKAEKERTTTIRAAIGDAASATALLGSTQERITALEELSTAWAQLASAAAKVPADQRTLSVDDATERAAVAARECDAAEELLTQKAGHANSLAGTRDEAAPLAAAFRDAMTERQRVVQETKATITLATLVTAGNAKRLQLRSYALQRRFASVLAAASVHLEHMSSGKFAFQLSEETAKSGQSGLGISLLDSWTGQPQDPKSLSGGETFYASLALALGLADVVRGEAGGSVLETLFVDEGFGSLDQDTLNQVLEQLDQLRAGNRVVGVVSHVTEMKESIPDRIEVRRQPDNTSTITTTAH